MILAIHQPNFCPWLPFIDKVNKADVFVFMVHCQYEKNGWQNRCKVWDKWWTVPVNNGKEEIASKRYANNERMISVNIPLIESMCKMLGVNTSKVRTDFPTDKKGTERIIELCKHFECNRYLTNMDAVDKYLDQDMMLKAGITLVPHTCAIKKHTFEAIAELGIDGVAKFLKKEKEDFIERAC